LIGLFVPLGQTQQLSSHPNQVVYIQKDQLDVLLFQADEMIFLISQISDEAKI
jgi:hypothetical protein